MGFTVDTNNTSEQGLIKPGDYEVVIKEVTEGTSSQKGTPYIQIELVVRNDVNQEYKNKHLWYTIWDTPKTRESGAYAKNINTVSKHSGIQNGASFNSVADWGRFIQGRPVMATVKHEEYNGETKERVSYISATKFPQCQHVWQQSNNQQQQGGNQNQQQNNNQGGYYNNGQNVAGTGQGWTGNNNSQQMQSDDLPF